MCHIYISIVPRFGEFALHHGFSYISNMRKSPEYCDNKLSVRISIDMIPNINIKWGKVSCQLRSVILVLLISIKLTYMLSGHLCANAVSYLIVDSAKFHKVRWP